MFIFYKGDFTFMFYKGGHFHILIQCRMIIHFVLTKTNTTTGQIILIVLFLFFCVFFFILFYSNDGVLFLIFVLDICDHSTLN